MGAWKSGQPGCCCTCAATLTGQVTNCANTGVSGVSVTVKRTSDLVVLGTTTTDASGNWSLALTIPSSGVVVNVLYAKGSATGANNSVSLICGANAIGIKQLTIQRVNLAVFSCGSYALANCTVTVNDGTTTFTPTSISGGVYSFDLAAASYTFSVTWNTAPRFTVGTGSFSVTICSASPQVVNVYMLAAAGYYCLTGFAIPVKATLKLTGPGVPGVVSLVNTGSGGWNSASFGFNYAAGPSIACCTASGSNPTTASLDTGGQNNPFFFFRYNTITAGSCPGPNPGPVITFGATTLSGQSEAPAFNLVCSHPAGGTQTLFDGLGSGGTCNDGVSYTITE
ncbi:MAG: hypothetical protein NVSMB9_31270 [Isosphaeraceae bacterium]